MSRSARSRRSRSSTRSRARRCCPRCGSPRSSTAGSRREAFEEVAEALDLTPAYCMSVASFYDMFHSSPSASTRSRCARTSRCGLVGRAAGARGVRARARRSARRDDRGRRGHAARGRVPGRLRLAPTVVAVDHRYRQSVTPEDVPAIVQELRNERRARRAPALSSREPTRSR